MAKRKRTFSADFETTVYEGQTYTEVWAAAIVELWTEDVHIFNCFEDFWEYCINLRENILVYFHNLKFDGSFILDNFMREYRYEPAMTVDEKGNRHWIDKVNDMKANTYRYNISYRGQWYSILFKTSYGSIEIRDSLKLITSSVKEIGESFGTKHKKLSMEYEGFRKAGGIITPKEKEYIANDVLVVKEGLEIMYEQGHTRLTIGSCAYNEFKHIYTTRDFKTHFPNLYELDSPIKDMSAGYWIRKTYYGGWVYLVPEKAGKVLINGTTADVNSLYPSRMHSESGCGYPIGLPNWWTGNYIPDAALENGRYYFVHIKTRFRIKEGYLPFIQIKGDVLYCGTENLTTSDIKVRQKDGSYKYVPYRIGIDGNIEDARVDLFLNCIEYQRVLEHYDVSQFEIKEGCWFFTELGLFDPYIDKWRKMKEESKGAKREIAKKFQNTLYGQFGKNTDSSFKYCILDNDNEPLRFGMQEEYNKKPAYIPIASATTGFARDFTIRAAQKNYHGVDKPGFCYADTDSLHNDIEPDKLIGLPIHPTHYNHWKLESCWDKAIFVRQKTYIEHVVKENLKPIKEPYYLIKCAGMGKGSKDNLAQALNHNLSDEQIMKLPENERLFYNSVHDLSDFKVGIRVPGTLRPHRIVGGIVLRNEEYELKG